MSSVCLTRFLTLLRELRRGLETEIEEVEEEVEVEVEEEEEEQEEEEDEEEEEEEEEEDEEEEEEDGIPGRVTEGGRFGIKEGRADADPVLAVLCCRPRT